MAGALVVAFIIIVVLPVTLMALGAGVAGILGWALKDDAEDRHEGSELIELNQ